MGEVRKVPRQRRSRETVDTLLEAAAQMFTREGLAATTNRIAERAGLSVGTLYQYFPNKHALLRALAERHLVQARTRLDVVFVELRDTRPGFEETLRAILNAVAELHRDRPALHALLHRVAPHSAEEAAALHAFEDHLAAEVAFHLERCGRGGADPQYLAQTLVHAIDAHLHRVLTRRRLDTDALMTLALGIISTPQD
ncbi:TetR/AcrR family transcriptional regulator [Nocardia cyriacigeorgica]|uniref:TetR/AcrR family transcriptional regulator n=1 Tax=Nocardia cyriacigeorgica TaxID=135487 RepID=UPI001895A4CA|nr:TetR/AcrR family transcriptional regulator [Nocardia cyriacigeorgica]MBF6101054.1 TetR/AcrR family transcriptional regulator [Nocardia cyriacigeorgica]MBF6517209.1 TetR/AcrR family transcriptional regulator [Nocardia cyriacigeorgica]